MELHVLQPNFKREYFYLGTYLLTYLFTKYRVDIDIAIFHQNRINIQSNQIKFICDKKEHNATQKNKANMSTQILYRYRIEIEKVISKHHYSL